MRARNLILFAFTALLLSGCAPHAKLLVWRPAAEEIQGVNKLVILDLDGEEPYGRIARGALEAQFAENRHYTLVDPAVLGPARSIKNGEGTTDVSAALAAAKSAGVDAILTGQVVSYKVDDAEQRDSHVSFGESTGKGKGASFSAFGIGIDNNHTITREASVSLTVKLLDVQSQQVIAVRESSHHVVAQQVNGEGALPARERVLTELLTACAKDVVALIAPHYVPADVTLAWQYYGNGTDDVSRGNELAKQGDWAGAAASWEAALKLNPPAMPRCTIWPWLPKPATTSPPPSGTSTRQWPLIPPRFITRRRSGSRMRRCCIWPLRGKWTPSEARRRWCRARQLRRRCLPRLKRPCDCRPRSKGTIHIACRPTYGFVSISSPIVVGSPWPG